MTDELRMSRDYYRVHLQVAPWKRRKIARARRNEEKSWAAKSGPVKVYYRGPTQDAAIVSRPPENERYAS